MGFYGVKERFERKDVFVVQYKPYERVVWVVSTCAFNYPVN